MKSEEPISRIRARPTCATTSTLRTQARRSPVEPRPPSRRLSCRLAPVAWRAGTVPKRMPVPIEIAMV